MITFRILTLPLIVVLFSAAFCRAQSGIDTTLLCRKWIIEGDVFPADTVFLKVFETEETESVCNILCFLNKGKLIRLTHVPKGMGAQTGRVFHVDDGYWEVSPKYKNKNIFFLIVHLKQTMQAQSEFEYKIMYKIVELSKEKMVLIKGKILHKRRFSNE